MTVAVTTAMHNGDAVAGDDVPPEPAVPCMIIEGVFAYVIQLLLAVVAIAALVIKRYWKTTEVIGNPLSVRIREPPRKFNIWLLDVLKQCTGHAMAHVFNIILAVMLARVRLCVVDV